jgi:DNA/RNA-binding domain of Phe-tRNA-synthetase-like protein
VSDDPDLLAGWIDRGLREELPGLRLVSAPAPAVAGRSPRALRRRLAALADRYHGARALSVRTEPVPAAYRVFFRHAGMDPDDRRPPSEAAAMRRLVEGGFVSRSWLEDALLLAVLETGVPVWALDAERVDGPLGIRVAGESERLGEGELAPDLRRGRMVVADAAMPVAGLFDDAVAPSHAPTRHTTNLLLFAIAVDGVPDLHVEEAMFTCVDALGGDLEAG